MPGDREKNRNSSAILLILFFILAQILTAGHRFVLISPVEPRLPVLFPVPEILLAIALAMLPGRRRVLRLLSASIFAAGLLFSAGELFYRYFYLDHFRPLSDLQLFPAFFSMLLKTFGNSPGLSIAVTVGLLAAVFGLPSWFLLGWLQRRQAGRRKTNSNIHGRWLLPLILFASAGLSFLYYPQGSITKTVGNQVRDSAAETSKTLYQKPDAEVTIPPTEPKAAGEGITISLIEKDLHIFVIESYGSTIFATIEYLDHMLPVYTRLEQEMMGAGWLAFSGFVRSPAFGGRSWMADASLLSGIQIKTQAAFDQIAEREQPAELLAFLGDNNYYRIYAAPGTTAADESWRSAYPFEEYLLSDDYDYSGPFLNLGAMSDQFILHSVTQRHLLPFRKEFALYLLVSSHVPFKVVPKYIEDWSLLSNGEVYYEDHLMYFENNWLTGGELAEGYLAGIEYSLTTTAGYLSNIIEERGLTIIVGDHQPRKPVSDSRAGYAVPIHILLPEELPVTVPQEWKMQPGFIPEYPLVSENDYPEMAAMPALIKALLSEKIITDIERPADSSR
jgi:hypothetical protein